MPIINGKRLPYKGDQEQQSAVPAGEKEQQQSFKPSKEMQDQYTVLVSMALKYIHGQGAQQVIKRLSVGDPTDAVARVSAGIMRSQARSAQGRVNIDDVVLAHAGYEIVAEVANLAKEAGIIQAKNDRDLASFVDKAYMKTLQLYEGEEQAEAQAQPPAQQTPVAEGVRQGIVSGAGAPPGAM